jgi:Flp pilus assembly protein TadG
MRVRGFSLARLRDDEQGAVLAIVAISLIVLLGMAVLTFDLGRGVFLKRNMVNAADAGALAAARECGLGNGEGSAQLAADELVADNNASATVTGFQIDPGPAQCEGAANPDPDGRNTVTVTVSVDQEYFFAQIFGADGGTVVASATAEWTAGATTSAPLMFDMSWMEGVCDDPAFFTAETIPPGMPEPECEFLFDNDGGNNGGIGGGTWGWLDPTQWNVESDENCRGLGVDKLRLFVQNGVPLSLNPQPPTYVCSVSGLKEPGWDELDAREGDVLFFPLVDPAGQIPPRPGKPDKYDVIDFIGLRVLEAHKLSGKERTCGTQVDSNASGACVTLSWPGLDPEGSGDGNPTVRLIG